MNRSALNPKVDAFIANATQWREEMKRLRTILLACGLTEDWKWSKPCYSFQGNNVIVIQAFKNYCALLFFKGVLLKDVYGILVKTGPNTRVGRQIRIANVSEIAGLEDRIKSCIRQAIEVEKAGLQVDSPDNVELDIPEEFEKTLAKSPALTDAFYALTPGRQRAYLFYFSGAKQSETRVSRIKKHTGQILNGKGLND